MSLNIVSSDRRSRAIPLGLLLVSVWAMLPFESWLTGLVPAPSRQLMSVAGNSGALAVLGGMRTVVAGACWLRANLAWERRDADATTALLQMTVLADERPLYFWLNGARMLAYDLPEWDSVGAPTAWLRRKRLEQAGVALAFLAQGLEAHPRSAELMVEMANLHLHVLGDREGAAFLFRQAAEQPEAPFYAARIHAELLRQLGRPAEALAWMKKCLPGLPEDDPAARRTVVIARIAQLERELAEDDLGRP